MSAAGDDAGGSADRDLADRALRGDPAAWDALARRHTRRVVVALLARGVGLDVAEDVAQETWLRLIERQQSGRLGALDLPGLAISQAWWLVRETARTSARRHQLAEAGGGATAIDVDRSPRPDEQAADRERLAIVESELARCPARARAIFVAVYGRAARTPAEVAAEQGLSLQRVRQSLCETRARLRRAIVDREGEGEPR